MSNPITRRFALFRIASVGAATAVAAAPVAIAAIQPKNSESADLIRLGDDMTAAAKHFAACDAARSAAKMKCDELWPMVPHELFAVNVGSRFDYQAERDCDDKPISRTIKGRKFPLFIDYVSARILQDRIAELPELDTSDRQREDRQRLESLLAFAVDYDQKRAAALEATNYEAVVSAWYQAEFAVTQLLRQIADTPALTPLGITIKAQAYQASAASAALGKEGRFQASIHLGPSIADDVCRILSEGDEA